MFYNFDQVIDRRSTQSIKWRWFDADVLPMWVADMDFPSPQPVIDALEQRIKHSVFGYERAAPELRETIVARLKNLYHWEVPPDSIVFLSGVVPGFNVAIRAFTAPGDGLLIQTPVYPPILSAAGDAGRGCNAMELTRRPDGYYTIDFDLFEQRASAGTRMFILCNPHNPVGRVFRQAELERMAEICRRYDILICSDEIHGDLVFRGYPHLPIASLAPEIAAHTLTLMAPSKTYNIAGLHCAFAVIPNPDLRKRFVTLASGLAFGSNLLGYTAALAAYRDSQSWLDQVLAYLESNRDFVAAYIGEHMPSIKMAKPEGTYLAWLDCRAAGIPGTPQEFFLEQGRVAFNDGATFGPGGEGFVRLNFACPRSLLVEGLTRMRSAIRERQCL